MLPYPILYDLVRQRQRELEREAERTQMIKEATENGQVTRRDTLRVWLGRRLISWGDRLQSGSPSMPVPGTRRAPYSGC